MVRFFVQVVSASLALGSMMVQAAPMPQNTSPATDFRANYKKPSGYDKVMEAQKKNLETLREQAGNSFTGTDNASQYLADIMELESKLPTLINDIFGPNGPGGGQPDVVKPVLERRGGGNKNVVQGSGPSSFGDVLSQYAAFSAASYCDLQVLKNWGCKTCQNKAAGTTNVTTFDDGFTGMQGYVGFNARLNTVVVAYRGSSNIQNWIQNLAFIRVDANIANAPSAVSVHFGFQNIWNAVSSDVTPAVSALLKANPSATVSVVGHSLGGAVATMSALGLVQGGIVPASKVRIYSQGAPRIGNEAFYSWVRGFGFAQVLRGVNYNDLVPHLPPTPLGFRHHLTQQWIDSTGRIDNCDDVDPKNAGEDTNCANSTFPWYSTAPHVSYFGSNMGGADC
ncbi:hypothetical protein HDU67_005110 [Dinochytrium kinnereticum]|nr:hypothetical protein HDU67_005110 [Dinochytrium kinnereticum]